MAAKNGLACITVRMPPEVRAKAKRVQSLRQLRTGEDVTLNEVLATAIESGCDGELARYAGSDARYAGSILFESK